MIRKIQDEVVVAMDKHAVATTHQAAMHAFDDLTRLLNETRLCTCRLCEMVLVWREAQQKVDDMNETLSKAQEHET